MITKVTMKEEPSKAPFFGVVNDDRMDVEELMEIPEEQEVELDIKHVLPPVIHALVTNPLENVPNNGTNSRVKLSTNPLSYFNEDDEGESELDEIEAIMNDGELDVKDVKPVAIPIPILRTEMGSPSKNIIINYTKPKREGEQTKPKPCVCTICHTGFPTQQLFQLHMSNMHSDKRPYPCSHCGKGFASSEQVKVHETIHDPNRFKGEPQFGCDFCDKKYHLKRSLEGHRKKAHLGYKPPKRPSNKIITEHHSTGVRNHRPPPKKDEKVFKCPHCDLKFAMRCLIRKHLTCHTRERAYQCTHCDQRFASNQSLRCHMRNRHLNPSGNPRPLRPQFMYKQPCPCEICGKVFKVPSQLQKHMTLHTGEKAHECSSCGQRFRLKQDLNKHFKRHLAKGGGVNEIEAYKCLICGKDGFLNYSDMRNHRSHVHRHIPFDSEKEMPYACGICGKPYFQKFQAMVCALLKHDPTSLYAAMFKHKCPDCPAERFGYHSTLALRRHWEKEHTEIPLPVHYRAFSGMYEDTNGREDHLPSVTVNKELARSIKENGPTVEYDFPLYTEFDLLPVENKFYRQLIKVRKRKSRSAGSRPVEGPFTCGICGAKILHSRNFTRHVKLHEKDTLKTSKQGVYNCTICEKRFRKSKTLRSHEKVHSKNVAEIDHLANPRQGAYSCGICEKRFGKAKTLRLHEKLHQNHKLNHDGTTAVKRPRGRPPAVASSAVKRKENVGDPGNPRLKRSDMTSKEPVRLFDHCFSVNCKDAAAVRRILGNRGLRINVSRVNSQRNNNDKESEMVRGPPNNKPSINCQGKVISNKTLKIILRRVDD